MEDTLLGTICTRPSIRVLNYWKANVTFAITEIVIHVFTVLTQGLSPSAACQIPTNATVVVALETIIFSSSRLTAVLLFARGSILIAPVSAILQSLAKLPTTKTPGTVVALKEVVLFAADVIISLARLN